VSRLLRGRQAARTERSTNGIVCALTVDAKRRGDELPALEQFFSAISWVAVGEDVARAAGELARRYRRAGRESVRSSPSRRSCGRPWPANYDTQKGSPSPAHRSTARRRAPSTGSTADMRRAAPVEAGKRGS
jgi:hypothetical protein